MPFMYKQRLSCIKYSLIKMYLFLSTFDVQDSLLNAQLTACDTPDCAGWYYNWQIKRSHALWICCLVLSES